MSHERLDHGRADQEQAEPRERRPPVAELHGEAEVVADPEALGPGDVDDTAEPRTELGERRQRGGDGAGVVAGVAGQRESDGDAHDRGDDAGEVDPEEIADAPAHPDCRCRRIRAPPELPTGRGSEDDEGPGSTGSGYRARRVGRSTGPERTKTGTHSTGTATGNGNRLPSTLRWASNNSRGESPMSPGPEDQWRPPEPPPGRSPRPGSNGSPLKPGTGRSGCRGS